MPRLGMKTTLRNTVLLVATAALAAGCASHPANVVLAPVGPERPPSAPALTADQQGTLVVYSAFDDNPDFNRRDFYQRAYTDYVIRTDTGHLLRRVQNDSGTIVLEPAAVNLPAGRYLVQADANGLGEVTVPVVIAPKQLTSVHLEADASAVPQTQNGG